MLFFRSSDYYIKYEAYGKADISVKPLIKGQTPSVTPTKPATGSSLRMHSNLKSFLSNYLVS